MNFLVTKASDDYWYKICQYNNIEEIYQDLKCSFIVDENFHTSEEDFKFWNNMKKEDIPKIMNCFFHITIYDSYIE